jgi:ribonuclease Z
VNNPQIYFSGSREHIAGRLTAQWHDTFRHMHEIVSPLKRGIHRSQPFKKAVNRRLRNKGRLIKRVSLSDVETLDLLEEHQHGGGSEPRRRRLRSLVTPEGDLKTGYNLKIGPRGQTHWITTVNKFQAAPVGQWLGGGSKLRPKALFWGPKLAESAGKSGAAAQFLLSLETFQRNTTVEGVGNKEQVPEELEAQQTQSNPEFPPKMRSFVQILTSPTADTPGTTLLLHFERNRYLFGNVGEGTQRVCTQRGIGLSRVNSVFLTGTVNWQTTGGIIGMVLTLADVVITQQAHREVKLNRDKGLYIEQPRLALHGGKNLTHMIATTRRFVFRKGMPMDVYEVKGDQPQDEAKTRDWVPSYTDANIKVWAMAIKPDASPETTRKRSHEEMSDNSTAKPATPTSGDVMSREEREHLNDQIRRGVVSHMFDSDWKLDALKAMNLRDVQLPAAIFVRNLDGKIEKYEGPLPGGDDLVPDVEVLVRMPWPGASVESLPPTTPSTEAISYIVKNHPQRGKFNPAQAKLLGLQKGPSFRLLTEGKSVTTADGKIITPEMVLGPGKQGSGFAIVELPDKSYVDNLINRDEWSSTEVMDGVGTIIWILGKGVVEDPRLVQFRETHSKLTHIISSPETLPNRITLDSAAEAAIRLNLVDPERFPVPVYDNEVMTRDITALPPNNYIKALPGLVVQLEPRIEVQNHSLFPILNTAEVIEKGSVDVQRLAEIARKTVNDPVYQSKHDLLQKDIPSKDAEIITLGTGSSLPSKYRNVSATLVRVPGYGSYLLDCGENTLGQMKRVFGSELPQVIKDLKLIWISHLHADHHLGTVSVIKEWYNETRKDQAMRSNRLMVASDKGMLGWLEEYAEVEDYGYSRLHLVTMPPVKSSQKLLNQSDIKAYGLSSITACAVNHCKGALAVILEFPNGFKVAYSGDCLPSEEFASVGKGSTLLIHEATFDDELAGDALAKKHSTTGDALRIGKLMRARRILLTHFSQRYQKIPVMENVGGEDQVAIVAFDYMRVKISDFAKVEHFRPALLELYKDREEE